MRWMIVIGLVLLVLSGCSYKSGTVDVAPFAPQKKRITQGATIQKIYLKSVFDKRAQQSVVARITNAKGEEAGYATLGRPLELWVFQGLSAGLEAMGYTIVETPVKEAKTITVEIHELMAHYDGSVLTKENLYGTMALTVTLKRGNKTIKKRVSQSQQKWHKPIYAPEAFEPFLHSLMEEVLGRTVHEINMF